MYLIHFFNLLKKLFTKRKSCSLRRTFYQLFRRVFLFYAALTKIIKFINMYKLPPKYLNSLNSKNAYYISEQTARIESNFSISQAAIFSALLHSLQDPLIQIERLSLISSCIE